MEKSTNFVDCLQIDLVSKILAFLDDSADLIRASVVSRSWRHFVILNRLSKKLCLRKVPLLSSINCVIEENDGILKISEDVVSRNPINLETLEREHKIFSSLLQILATPITCPKECIALPFGVSSTDRYPAENIINTLDPVDRPPWGYWSSVGQSDPNVPEHILYLLKSSTCIVSEIYIRPFEVFWEPGRPVYSAKFVRFRMGRPKSADLADLAEISGTLLRPSQKPALDKYEWTYTSPVFPMAQESRLQKFKLPEPTICMGGFLHIELLGRAQREEIDGLFYICIGHVSVMGQTLEPAFNFKMLPSGELLLKHCPYALEGVIENFSNDGLGPPSGPITTMCRLRLLRDLIPEEIAEDILDLDHFHEGGFV